MGHGGARPGAGRKPKAKKFANKSTAEEILGQIDEKAFWLDLLTATHLISVTVIGGEDGERENQVVPDYKTRLDAAKYLTDRRDGKAHQSIAYTNDSPELTFGNLRVPSFQSRQPGSTDKPN